MSHYLHPYFTLDQFQRILLSSITSKNNFSEYDYQNLDNSFIITINSSLGHFKIYCRICWLYPSEK